MTELNDIHNLYIASFTTEDQQTYLRFNRNFLTNFFKKKREYLSISAMSLIFTEIEINYYLKLFYYDTDEIHNFNLKLIVKTEAYYSIMIFKSVGEIFTREELLHIYGSKHEESLKKRCILSYLNSNCVITELRKLINDSTINISTYNKMLLLFKQNQYSTEYKRSFHNVYNDAFTKEQKNEFEKIMDTGKTNSYYNNVYNTLDDNRICDLLGESNYRKKSIRKYDDLIIWENVDDGIMITYLTELIGAYSNNGYVFYKHNHNRCLCIPFVLLPTIYSKQLADDLIKHPYAFPVFKIKYIKNISGLSFFSKYSYTEDQLQVLSMIIDFRKQFDPEDDIKCSKKCNSTDDEIQKLFGGIDETHKKKRKRPKKTKKNKDSHQSIDISNINENEIIELNNDDDSGYNAGSQLKPTEKLEELDEPTNESNESDSDSDDELILNEIQNINNDIVVKFNAQPYSIVFYQYEYITYKDKDLITFLLNDLYNTSEKFQTYMTQYNTIRVIQSFHKDFSAKNNSTHFNVVFYNTIELTRTPVFHAYIKNNSICSLTTITNII